MNVKQLIAVILTASAMALGQTNAGEKQLSKQKVPNRLLKIIPTPSVSSPLFDLG